MVAVGAAAKGAPAWALAVLIVVGGPRPADFSAGRVS